MISAEKFCAGLDRAGIDLVTGVPCSFFGGPLREWMNLSKRNTPSK